MNPGEQNLSYEGPKKNINSKFLIYYHTISEILLCFYMFYNVSRDNFITIHPLLSLISQLFSCYFTPKKERILHTFLRLSTFFRVNYDVACPMEFRMYPLDKQICQIKLQSYTYTNTEVTVQKQGSVLPRHLKCKTSLINVLVVLGFGLKKI